jgi:hypothetical protein
MGFFLCLLCWFILMACVSNAFAGFLATLAYLAAIGTTIYFTYRATKAGRLHITAKDGKIEINADGE